MLGMKLVGSMSHNNDPMNLSGKTIVVVGASAGLGRETALLLSQLGGRLVLLARRKDVLEEVLEALSGDGHCSITCDVSEFSTLPSVWEEVVEQVGTVDGLVYCPASQKVQGLRFITQESLLTSMQVGVEAASILIECFAESASQNKHGGSVVLLSSVSAYVGQPGFSVYAASKGAVEALSRRMARRYISEQIRVNCVVPSQVLTESAQELQRNLTPEQWDAFEKRHPLGFGTPQDIAQSIGFLIADTGRWITGTSLVVDGGYLASSHVG